MKTLHESWRAMMSASYGPFWFIELTASQQADMKRAFMAGAQTFMLGWLEDEGGNILLQYEQELAAFVNQCDNDAATLNGWKP